MKEKTPRELFVESKREARDMAESLLDVIRNVKYDADLAYTDRTEMMDIENEIMELAQRADAYFNMR